MPEDYTSKEERVAAALARVKAADIDHNTCLDFEDKQIAKHGGVRMPYGLSIPWKSGNRQPDHGEFYISLPAAEDLSIHEIRRWFIWTGASGGMVFRDDWQEHIHPKAIADLSLTSAGDATGKQFAIREWYHIKYNNIVDWIDEYFDELNGEEECFHHWHPIKAPTVEIMLDASGEFDEWNISDTDPDMRCCECEDRQTFTEITGQEYDSFLS